MDNIWIVFMQNERQKEANTTQPTWISILIVLIIHTHNFVYVYIDQKMY